MQARTRPTRKSEADRCPTWAACLAKSVGSIPSAVCYAGRQRGRTCSWTVVQAAETTKNV